MPTATTSDAEKSERALVMWRTALVASGLYLGVPQTVDAVQWMRDGRTLRLVARNPDGVTPGTVPVIRQIYGEAGESISLSLLVQITEDDFWMMPDGFWRSGSGGARKFSDVKLTCTGAAVDNHPLPADFNNALHTLEHIMDGAKSTGATQEGVIKTTNEGPKLRFRHQLFQVRLFSYLPPSPHYISTTQRGVQTHAGGDGDDLQGKDYMSSQQSTNLNLQQTQPMKST